MCLPVRALPRRANSWVDENISKIRVQGIPPTLMVHRFSIFFSEQNGRFISIPIFGKKTNGIHLCWSAKAQDNSRYTWLVPRRHSLSLPCKSPTASLLPSSHRLVEYWGLLEVIYILYIYYTRTILYTYLSTYSHTNDSTPQSYVRCQGCGLCNPFYNYGIFVWSSPFLPGVSFHPTCEARHFGRHRSSARSVGFPLAQGKEKQMGAGVCCWWWLLFCFVLFCLFVCLVLFGFVCLFVCLVGWLFGFVLFVCLFVWLFGWLVGWLLLLLLVVVLLVLLFLFLLFFPNL